MSAAAPVTAIPYVALGGVPLSIDVGQDHGWTITSGVKPFMAIFDVSTGRAVAIKERGKTQLADAHGPQGGTRTRDQAARVGPLSFEIRVPNKTPLEIKGLYVLSDQPGTNRNKRGVLIADRRWLWPKIRVERSYNMRRRTGEFRLLQGDVTPIQVAAKAPDYAYRRATMNGEKPWTAREVLEDVLLELCGEGGWVIDGDLPIQDTIEGLYLRGDGDAMLERVLGFLPGTSVYPHPDGKIHVYNTLKNGEINAAMSAGTPRWGTGNWLVVDRSLIRPKRVHVYFGRELEVRFDYLESGVQGTRTRGREPRSLENVLPCPDPLLTLADGRTVAMGTWITVEEGLAAWAALADFPAEKGPLDQARIRRFYMTGLAFLHHLFAMQVGTHEINQTWARRINAIQEHWRRTFRVLSPWRDKIRSFRGYRVAIVDQENGTRARSDAYFDHVVKLGARGLTKNEQGDDCGWNTTSWAEDLADAKVAPADVEVLDEENGVIRITPRLDLGGLAVAIAPGTVNEIPKASAGEITTLWGKVHLDEDWKLALVVTVVQDVPNDLGRLHLETVTASQAIALLPGVAPPPPGTGPDVETGVDEGIDTARFAWVDAESAAIEEAIFTGVAPPVGLMINPETVRELAVAQAARVYSLLLDRGEGSFAVSLKPDVVPVGALQQVTHRVSRPSEREVITTTALVMPPIVVPPSVTSLLSESVRRTVQRLVQQ